MRLSKIISVIIHPIFMPITALYLSLKLIPNIGFAISNYINYIYLILLFSTIIMPLMSILFLIRNKVVYSLEMRNHKERSVPLFITFIWMGSGYYMLKGVLILAPILKAELIGGIIILLISSVISRYWKISIHMLGIGGIVGVLFSLNILFGGLLETIILSVLFAGVLGVARLYEKAHNETQIYTGFWVGFLIEVSCILFF